MSMEDYDYLFKIVLIGNAGVGKTCLVRRFTQVCISPYKYCDEWVVALFITPFFPGSRAFSHQDKVLPSEWISWSKQWKSEGRRSRYMKDAFTWHQVSGVFPQLLTAHTMFFQLQIWDTAGQERFRSITQSYYRSANALILTYDITCEDSFRCLPEWLREIEQYANNQVVTILVGKKLDFALCYTPAGSRRVFRLDKRHSVCVEYDSALNFYFMWNWLMATFKSFIHTRSHPTLLE